ncbi:MAG: hypothetical protein II525_03925, partial [Bacteroidales bacterium]|nr:hypothetical protein [Bacteroidales bacterium]
MPYQIIFLGLIIYITYIPPRLLHGGGKKIKKSTAIHIGKNIIFAFPDFDNEAPYAKFGSISGL